MKDRWSKPYHVVLEVENRKCKIVKWLSPLGLKHLKVVDIRSSNPHSVKHLIELDPSEIRQIQNPPAELRAILAHGKGEGKSSIWLEAKAVVYATPFCPVKLFWYLERALKNIR